MYINGTMYLKNKTVVYTYTGTCVALKKHRLKLHTMEMAWEDADHKVSEAACGTPTDNPGPDQHIPWTDQPPPKKDT
jgi:hypothetical protein